MIRFSEENGYAPSQAEIAKHFGFKSLGTVQNYLVRLERQGLLKKELNARRGSQVLSTALPSNGFDSEDGFNTRFGDSQPPRQESSRAVPLPLLGRVAAGRPIEAVLNAESLDVPESMLRGGDNFVLHVKGDSMIGDGILDGDYVIVKRQTQAQEGQTVVALINNEATLKRYRRKGSQIELHSSNPAYPPIVVQPNSQEGSTFKIEGVLVGLIRKC
ncbi:MAG: transcriptional repressor LexA [Bdellovibrionales bacterium]|nr:transcriptional repressor LexA [Bdellovibrionales bacterium]